MPLPPAPSLQTILQRLLVIFPEGTENRNWLTREIAGKTIYAMFYIGAVEGEDVWLRPNQVTRMTNAQLDVATDEERTRWYEWSMRSSRKVTIPEGRWYADNTREPIRDETLRDGLMALGAVVKRPNLPTTSGLGAWALARDFAEMFVANDIDFPELLDVWRDEHLTPGARTRVRLVQRGLGALAGDEVEVRFPGGERRRLAPGPSSVISRAVIEVFAPHFLAQPGVLWLSESANKAPWRDVDLATHIGIDISAERLLPDIILVDLGLRSRVLFVFIEVVASAGPITTARRLELTRLVTNAGHAESDAAFVTAFLDRGQVYPAVSRQIAWDTFVWYVSEPHKIIHRRSSDAGAVLLADLVSE